MTIPLDRLSLPRSAPARSHLTGAHPPVTRSAPLSAAAWRHRNPCIDRRAVSHRKRADPPVAKHRQLT